MRKWHKTSPKKNYIKETLDTKDNKQLQLQPETACLICILDFHGSLPTSVNFNIIENHHCAKLLDINKIYNSSGTRSNKRYFTGIKYRKFYQQYRPNHFTFEMAVTHLVFHSKILLTKL